MTPGEINYTRHPKYIPHSVQRRHSKLIWERCLCGDWFFVYVWSYPVWSISNVFVVRTKKTENWSLPLQVLPAMQILLRCMNPGFNASSCCETFFFQLSTSVVTSCLRNPQLREQLLPQSQLSAFRAWEVSGCIRKCKLEVSPRVWHGRESPLLHCVSVRLMEVISPQAMQSLVLASDIVLCENRWSQFSANRGDGFYEGDLRQLPSKWQQIVDLNLIIVSMLNKSFNFM